MKLIGYTRPLLQTNVNPSDPDLGFVVLVFGSMHEPLVADGDHEIIERFVGVSLDSRFIVPVSVEHEYGIGDLLPYGFKAPKYGLMVADRLSLAAVLKAELPTLRSIVLARPFLVGGLGRFLDDARLEDDLADREAEIMGTELPMANVAIARDLALTAHKSDQYSGGPFSVHLEEAIRVALRFGFRTPDILAAIWLHDFIEHKHGTWRTIRDANISGLVADIVVAVTDVKAATRREAKRLTYPQIAKRKRSVIVKLSDRIANFEHDGPEAVEKRRMYFREHAEFRQALYRREHGLDAMWNHLALLMNDFAKLHT